MNTIEVTYVEAGWDRLYAPLFFNLQASCRRLWQNQ